MTRRLDPVQTICVPRGTAAALRAVRSAVRFAVGGVTFVSLSQIVSDTVLQNLAAGRPDLPSRALLHKQCTMGIRKSANKNTQCLSKLGGWGGERRCEPARKQGIGLERVESTVSLPPRMQPLMRASTIAAGRPDLPDEEIVVNDSAAAVAESHQGATSSQRSARNAGRPAPCGCNGGPRQRRGPNRPNL